MILLGERIKKRRLLLGMTQEQLGKLIGVTKVAISSYEKNTRTPKLDVIEKLASALKVDVTYLLGQDVSVIAEDMDLPVKVASEDLKILKELKKNKKLYLMLMNDPKRTVQLINNKMSK